MIGLWISVFSIEIYLNKSPIEDCLFSEESLNSVYSFSGKLLWLDYSIFVLR
jgi:hypothetical protein